MSQPRNALIHQFAPSGFPHFDGEGDQMIGFYFQFIDENDQPYGDLIGPYAVNADAERAAQRAFTTNDF